MTQKDLNGCGAVGWLDWMNASEAERAQLARVAVSQRYEVGDTIYWEGDDVRGIHVVESGMFGLRKIDTEGHSVLLRLLFEGQPFGHDSVLAGREIQSTTAECISPGVVHFIAAKDFIAVLEKNPHLGIHLLRNAARELAHADARMFEAMVAPVHIRLANLLKSFKGRFAAPNTDGAIVLRLPFPKRAIAEMIGTRPETISRMIRKLERDGIANFKADGIHLLAEDMFADDWDVALAA